MGRSKKTTWIKDLTGKFIKIKSRELILDKLTNRFTEICEFQINENQLLKSNYQTKDSQPQKENNAISCELKENLFEHQSHKRSFEVSLMDQCKTYASKSEESFICSPSTDKPSFGFETFKVPEFERIEYICNFNTKEITLKNHAFNDIQKDHSILTLKDQKKPTEQLDERKYRERLKIILQEYIRLFENKQIFLPLYSKEISLSIYKDALNSIPAHLDKSQFLQLTESLTRRDPKFAAAAFLFFSLVKENISINKSQMASTLNLDRTSLTNNINIIFNYLFDIPGYEFIYETVFPNRFTQQQYEKVLRYYINQIVRYIQKKIVSISSNPSEIEQIFNIYFRTLQIMEGVNKYDAFFKKSVYKTPKIIAAVHCLIYIRYYLDINLDGTHFISLLNKEGQYKLNAGDFWHSFHQYLKDFFTFNEQTFKNKVFNYLEKYISILKLWIESNFDNPSIKKDLLSELGGDFLRNTESLHDSAVQKGFQISLFSTNSINYFFPQLMALSLLYYNLKSNRALEVLASADKFMEYYKEELSIRNADIDFNYLSSNINNRLFPYIQENIGRYSGQVYNNDTFRNELKKTLDEEFHPELDFLLNLYNLTSLTPYEFAKNLGIYKGELKQLIRYFVKEKLPFRDTDTFKKIKSFIQKYANPQNLDVALK